MSENSVEKAVNAMFEAAGKASQAGAVVDWRSTCVSMANSLLAEIKRLEQEVLSEQEAKDCLLSMKEVLEAEKLVESHEAESKVADPIYEEMKEGMLND